MSPSRCAAVGLIAAAAAPGADGHSHYMTAIPNGMQVQRGDVAWYGVGHHDAMGSGPLNAFGEAFVAAGYEWTPELCAADSDGDGQTNGFELGDPDCLWTAGSTASRTTDISHPGFADSMSSGGGGGGSSTPGSSTASPTASSTASPATAAPAAGSTTAAPPPGTSTAPTAEAPSTTPSAASSAPSAAEAPAEEAAPGAEEAARGAEAEDNATTVAPTTTRLPTLEDAGSDALCDFDNEPVAVGYLWEPRCRMGMLGCNADAKHVQCRFCGAGAYAEIPCPPTSCRFPNEPFVPYFWDPSCEMGQLGCWADGIHAQCRFCGDHPYTSIACPAAVGGQGISRADVAAARDARCSFTNEPMVPYYWDAECALGKLGCLADGAHEQCRFCARRPFEGVRCPADVAPPAHRCAFPAGAEPAERYFWDASCEMGMLGCWADGLHAECRFCGGSTYWNVTCPTVLVTGAPEPEAAAGAAAAAAGQLEGRGPAHDAQPEAAEEPIDLSLAAPAAPSLAALAAAAALAVAPAEC